MYRSYRCSMSRHKNLEFSNLFLRTDPKYLTEKDNSLNCNIRMVKYFYNKIIILRQWYQLISLSQNIWSVLSKTWGEFYKETFLRMSRNAIESIKGKRYNIGGSSYEFLHDSLQIFNSILTVLFGKYMHVNNKKPKKKRKED